MDKLIKEFNKTIDYEIDNLNNNHGNKYVANDFKSYMLIDEILERLENLDNQNIINMIVNGLKKCSKDNLIAVTSYYNLKDINNFNKDKLIEIYLDVVC